MRSIWVYRDGKIVPKEEQERVESGFIYMPDTPGVVNPVTRQWLEGRADRREFMKRYDCREAEPSEFKNKGWESPRFRRRFGDPER